MKGGLAKVIVLAALLVAVPATLLMFTVRRDSVNVPYFDDYHMVPMFQAVDLHMVPIKALWTQDNENREVFPKLIMTATAYATDWNIRSQLIVNFAIALGTAVIVCGIIFSTIKRPALRLLSVLLTAFWLFSPAQAENWLWGWENVWYVCVAAVMLAIFYMGRLGKLKAPSIYHLAVPVVFGVIASFSLASGLLVWPIGLGMLLLQRQKRQFLKAWLACALVTFAAYFLHYVHPSRSPALSSFLHQPLNFVKFFLALLGRPISDQMHGAIIYGSVLLVLLIPLMYAVWRQRKNIVGLTPWLAITAFSLAALLVTAVGRVGGGVGNSLSSRYTTLSILYMIGLIGTSSTLLDKLKLHSKYIGLALLLMATVSTPLLFSSYKNGLYASRLRHDQMLQIRTCTDEPRPTVACLQTANFSLDTSTSAAQLKYLKARHWAGY